MTELDMIVVGVWLGIGIPIGIIIAWREASGGDHMLGSIAGFAAALGWPLVALTLPFALPAWISARRKR